jgi:hypothetical protein
MGPSWVKFRVAHFPEKWVMVRHLSGYPTYQELP